MVRLSRFAFVLAVGCGALCVENTMNVQESCAQGITYQSTSPAVCTKCGKIHGAPTTSSSSISQVSGYTPMATPVYSATQFPPASVPYTSGQSQQHVTSMPSTSLRTQAASGGTSNVLSALNAQRSRQGLGALGYDPTLQAVAERRARLMASTGQKSHPSGSFAPGRYEGVGWDSSYSPAGVSACFTSDPNMRVAGAAMATGRDGVYFCVVYR